MRQKDVKLGIYEKALPKETTWKEKFELAKSIGFQFLELSIDESDTRLSRLEWSKEERKKFRDLIFKYELTVPSICFSGHRRFPLGSHDPDIRKTSRELVKNAIELAVDLGIRTIQLAGYDVYYEKGDDQTNQWFIEGTKEATEIAAKENVMLAMEIMDTKYMSSMVRFLNLKRKINNPWFTVYPDIGNMTAWGNDLEQELEIGINQIVAIHLKDTKNVTKEFPGQFRDIPFGTGDVDFIGAFRILKKLCYTGPFLIEMWTEKANNPKQEIIAARKWIIEKMKEAGFIDE